MDIVGRFKSVDKFLSWFFVTLLVFGVTAGFARMYLITPAFLFDIEDRLSSDATLMSRIGEIRRKEIKFSDDQIALGESASFYVRIDGAGDSNYVRVRGIYTQTIKGIIYTIRDTTFSNQCP
jgi:hypothetical protein